MIIFVAYQKHLNNLSWHYDTRYPSVLKVGSVDYHVVIWQHICTLTMKVEIYLLARNPLQCLNASRLEYGPTDFSMTTAEWWIITTSEHLKSNKKFSQKSKQKVHQFHTITSPDCVMNAAWLWEAEIWMTCEREGKLMRLNAAHWVVSWPWPSTPHKLDPHEYTDELWTKSVWYLPVVTCICIMKITLAKR